MGKEGSRLGRLPVWARVAYAARCVRRVMPLVQGETELRDGSKFRKATHLLEEFAASGGQTHARVMGFVENEIEGASVMAGAGASLHTRAAFMCLPLVGKLMMAPWDVDPIEEIEFEAKRAAELHSPVFAEKYNSAQDFDLQLVEALARSEQWTDETQVPPYLFGAIWTFGPPPEFNEKASTGFQLRIELSVPEELSDGETLDLVKDTVLHADGLSRAYGGRGLRVEIGGIEIEKEVAVPIGGGT